MSTDLQGFSLERLEAGIAELAADLSRRLAVWLALVAEFDRRGGARRAGFHGTADWLAWRCGIGSRAAREHVRVARGLQVRPAVAAALAAGEVSYSKVRALTRAPDGEDEQDLLDYARRVSAAELERHVRQLRDAPSADLETANRAHGRRFVDYWWERDGSLSIRGRFTADDGAALIEAIETAASALHNATEAAVQTPGRGAQRADALVEILMSGSPRTRVVLHVDEPALASANHNRDGEICVVHDGPAVPSETARRHTCDAEVVQAHRTEDGSLDYGRARRVVSPPLRASLELRDQGCRFPGCARRHGLHAHHVVHWAWGGPTNADNLVLLCRFHHRLVHEDGFTIARRDATLRFHRPDGHVIPERPPPAIALAA